MATTKLGMRHLTANGKVQHVRTRSMRASKLVDRWDGYSSGGPIKLLDLDGMRRTAAANAAAHWQLWHQVVTGTKPARPCWSFADKHRADPHRYPLPRAQGEYVAQPRTQP
jgi:hypothetical protein